MIIKVVFSLLLLCCGQIFAQSGDDEPDPQSELDRVVSLAKPSIGQFRDSIRPILTASERDIEEGTKIDILPTWEVQARARVFDGKRVIQVNAGLFEVFDWISTAMVAIDGKYPTCAHKYLEYVFTSVQSNSMSVALDEESDRVYPPFEFAKQNPELCSGVTEALITKDQHVQQMRLIALGSSIMWTFSHELAHHLHHDERLTFHDPPTASELRISRSNEYRADRFAFRALSQPGFSPLGAMPAYLFIGVGGAAAEDEDESTHPSGPKRFKILFDALESFVTDPDYHAYLESSGQLTKWREAMNNMKIFVAQ